MFDKHALYEGFLRKTAKIFHKPWRKQNRAYIKQAYFGRKNHNRRQNAIQAVFQPVKPN